MLYKIRLLFFVFFTFPIFAKISGIIIDSSNNMPIENVNIVYGDFGAISNKEGKFSINGEEGDQLKFSHIGYLIKYKQAKNEMQIKLVRNIISSKNIFNVSFRKHINVVNEDEKSNVPHFFNVFYAFKFQR